MSFSRSLIKSTTSIRAPTLSLSRQFTTSISRKAEAHGSSSSEHYPQEGFSAPAWRNTLLILITGFGLYRLNDVYSKPVEGEEEELPFLTRYIKHYTPSPEVWKERNAQSLEIAKMQAENKLFLQDSERPPVLRLRYAGTFEHASPHSIPIGSQADLSDLKVKRFDE